MSPVQRRINRPRASRSTPGSRSRATSSLTAACGAATPGWWAPQGSMVRPGAAGASAEDAGAAAGADGQHRSRTGSGADTGAADVPQEPTTADACSRAHEWSCSPVPGSW